VDDIDTAVPPADVVTPDPGPWQPPGGAGPGDAGSRGRWRRRIPGWAWLLGALAVLVVAASLVLTFVRLPYYTIAPGDALDVSAQVKVDGKTVDSDGEVLLLFVRQRANVNGWRYIQASLDDDIDLLREETISNGLSPDEVRTLAQCDMQQSQATAKKVALEELGHDVPFADDGIAVLAVFGGRPAEGVLERGDVLLTIDGARMRQVGDVHDALDRVSPGQQVEVTYERDGEERTAAVSTEANQDGDAVLGVCVSRRFDFPVDVQIDTGRIGGPSAGLAMTLSVLDALSPADLTGGLSVAVTGEMEADGTVGSIGGIGQKAVSARANGADLMLVPESESPAQLAEARARAGDMPVVLVDDIDDALVALEEAGGEPLVAP
jgi:PDZ domain-containing protein